MRRILPACLVFAALGCGGAKPATETTPATNVAPAPASDQLSLAIQGAQRSPENKARDAYRHPAETLRFIGVGPTQHVVELWPGRGWYTEILAPLLREQGSLSAVVPQGNYLQPYKDFLATQPGIYDRVQLVEVATNAPLSFGADGSADVVLTFRNVHNWVDDGFAAQVFAAAFKVLKPGGILGIEDHRARPDTAPDKLKDSGYVSEETVIGLASAAGFTLEERSEINANPKDTTDHPKGVWTLPPSLALGETDRAKYVEIGESDRMTLRFKKPLN